VCLFILTASARAESPAARAESPAARAESPPAADTAAPAPPRITAFQAAILGVIEGLTEYLPVSSTGHLILANHAMGLSRFTDPARPLASGIEKVPAVDAFDIVIQLGAILAVLGLYRKRVGQMARGLAGKDHNGLWLLVVLAVAFLPAAVVGLLARHWITEHLFNPTSVIAALAAGGVLMIAIERVFRRRRREAARVTSVDQAQWWQALVIGLAQCLAMWPGTSRSMVTILAALVVGFDLVAAAEFSFLLALPTLGAATLYEGYKSWPVLAQSVGVDGMIIGLAVSGVVAALAVKGFVRWLTGHGLMPFGVYRILLAAALAAYFAVGL
jgi:undecaprenyl-diphosphatase